MVVIPISKQKCLNLSKKHNSLAYYCDECLNDIRRRAIKEELKFLESQYTICQGTMEKDGSCNDKGKGEKIYTTKIWKRIEILKERLKFF